jgi:hypothetical protein
VIERGQPTFTRRIEQDHLVTKRKLSWFEQPSHRIVRVSASAGEGPPAEVCMSVERVGSSDN